MAHSLLIACAIWACVCIVGSTVRQVRGDPQEYMQTANFIVLVLALGFIGLGA